MSNYLYQDLGGWTDSIKTIGTSVFETIQSFGAQKGRSELSEELIKAQLAAGKPSIVSRMPSWVLPVGIGAAALVLILVLKKKK